MSRNPGARPGRLVVFEGADGVGKTAVSALVKARLEERGQRVRSLSFPGRMPGSIGELVYRYHHAPNHELSPLARQALHVAAHIDTIERVISPALRDGVTVLLDRYWWSAWVYGLVAGCDVTSLKALIAAELTVWGRTLPTLAVLLRRPTPVDRIEPLAYWKRLTSGYEELAKDQREAHPVLLLDNIGSLEAMADAILEELTSKPMVRSTVARPKHPQGRARSHIAPLIPSAAYDSYWRFAVERQDVFFKRLDGASPPLTADPIVGTYKFTNAYRASDRTSQYLIRHVIYRPDLSADVEEVFFRILLFKLFNKIETWEALWRGLGEISYASYRFDAYERILSHLMAKGRTVYSAAYIMPPASRGSPRKHHSHLRLLEQMMKDELPARVRDASSLQRVFQLLKEYQGIGDFLAYQFAIDINYSEITSFPESAFVVPGPGAIDGIRKCFIDVAGLNEPEVIKFVTERQEREFERLGVVFKSLWGRPLQLIDCQNLFCEVDKYSRIRHPELAGVSGRLKIKQKFVPTGVLPEPWYPPKWGLNDSIKRTTRAPIGPQASLFLEPDDQDGDR